MQTFLSPNGHAFVKVILLGVDEDVELDCMIDTGFSGGIAVPSSLEGEFDFPVFTRLTYQLANGDEMEVDVHLGEIIDEGAHKQIAAIFADGDEGLVGIEFLRGKKFLLDLIDNEVRLA